MAAAYQAFEKHFSTLVKEVSGSVKSVADVCREECIIGVDTYDQVVGNTGKVDKDRTRDLLTAVSWKIQHQGTNVEAEHCVFKKFVGILKREPSFERIAKDLEETHAKIESRVGSEEPSAVDVESLGPNFAPVIDLMPPTSTSTPATTRLPNGAAYSVGEKYYLRSTPRPPPHSSLYLDTLQSTIMVARSEEQLRKDLEVELADKDSLLKTNKQEVQRLEKELKNVYTKYEDLNQEKGANTVKHKQEVMALKCDLAEKEREVNDLREKCQDYAERMEDQASRITDLANQLSSESTRKHSLQHDLTRLEEEKKVLEIQKVGAEDVLELKRKQLEEYKTKYEEAIGSAREILVLRDETIDDQLRECREQIEKLAFDLKVRQDVICKLTKANREHSLKETEFEKERQEFQSTVRQLSSEKHEKEAENQSLRQTNKTLLQRLYIHQEGPNLVFVVSVLVLFVAVVVGIMIVSFYAHY